MKMLRKALDSPWTQNFQDRYHFFDFAAPRRRLSIASALETDLTTLDPMLYSENSGNQPPENMHVDSTRGRSNRPDQRNP